MSLSTTAAQREVRNSFDGYCRSEKIGANRVRLSLAFLKSDLEKHAQGEDWRLAFAVLEKTLFPE